MLKRKKLGNHGFCIIGVCYACMSLVFLSLHISKGVCGSIVTHTYIYLYLYSYPSSCHHCVFNIHIPYVCYVLDTHAQNKYSNISRLIKKRRWVDFPYFFSLQLLRRIYVRAKSELKRKMDKKETKPRERERKENENKNTLNPSYTHTHSRFHLENPNHMVWLCVVCSVLVFSPQTILCCECFHTFCATKILLMFFIYKQFVLVREFVFVCVFVIRISLSLSQFAWINAAYLIRFHSEKLRREKRDLHLLIILHFFPYKISDKWNFMLKRFMDVYEFKSGYYSSVELGFLMLS